MHCMGCRHGRGCEPFSASGFCNAIVAMSHCRLATSDLAVPELMHALRLHQAHVQFMVAMQPAHVPFLCALFVKPQVRLGLQEVADELWRVTPYVYASPDNSAVICFTGVWGECLLGHLVPVPVRQ